LICSLPFANFKEKMSKLLEIQSGKVVDRSMAAEGLVVVFHGYGADRENLYDVAHGLSLHNSNLRFIIPNGIERYEGGGNGFQWFSLRDYRQEAMERKLSLVAPKIASWVKIRLEELNLSENQLSLVGFSQGAMLALYLAASALLLPRKIIPYSGLFVPPAVANNIDKDSEILAFHGDSDQVLPIEMTEASYKLLGRHNLKKFRFIRERGIDHYITRNAIETGAKFLLA
jgi:phospholipase/carboxylesterase